MDTTYHYPPELLDLLIDTIPLLTRSKPGVLDFLRGAGIQEQQLADLRQQVALNPDSISKYKIARTVLTRINNGGDRTLRERREVIKRVVEFDDFSTCWESDRLKAMGLVSRIREIVNAKDTFTRIKQERDDERRKRMEETEKRIEEKHSKDVALSRVRDNFYRLFGETDPYKRAKLIESVMAEAFDAVGIKIKDPFTIVDPENGKTIEQVDGMIEVKGYTFLVEIKWLSENLDKLHASNHLVRVYHRPETHGLFISATPFTSAALAVCTEALQKGRLIVLCTLQEIFQVLEARGDIAVFIKAKIDAVKAEKTAFPQVSALFGSQ
jgi:hypothetical protein